MLLARNKETFVIFKIFSLPAYNYAIVSGMKSVTFCVRVKSDSREANIFAQQYSRSVYKRGICTIRFRANLIVPRWFPHKGSRC